MSYEKYKVITIIPNNKKKMKNLMISNCLHIPEHNWGKLFLGYHWVCFNIVKYNSSQ